MFRSQNGEKWKAHAPVIETKGLGHQRFIKSLCRHWASNPYLFIMDLNHIHQFHFEF